MRSILTQKEAELRAQSVVSGVDYKLYLCLQKGTLFHGFGKYSFKLTATNHVFLDFRGLSVDSLSVNQTTVQKEAIGTLWKEGKLLLPSEHLKSGSENTVEVRFSNNYYTDGNGIHTFTDTDGSQYTYCQSEPYWINKVYPVFDQPDIKGRMAFLINAPQDWRVISNQDSKGALTPSEFAVLASSDDGFDKLVTTVFPEDFLEASQCLVHRFGQTPLLSSYLFNFVTGPFEALTYDGSDGQSIPMTIFCRKSQVSEAQSQQQSIFLYCKRGIEFFETFFNTKYPFGKYDFIFCPEFTVGAMEFPGAVTFNDRFLYKEQPTPNQVAARGKVIVHELAHMWFGNLVTMRWWNDLWLNESFADFACYTALAHFGKELPFENADGNMMFLARKFWGYNDDQLITTHPIAGPVESTDKADSIFDGITYAKGAAVLKQLHFILGTQQMTANLARFFAKHAWNNATLRDFLQEMNVQDLLPEGSKMDVIEWSAEWLEKAGTNSLEATFDRSVQGQSELTIKQSAILSDHPTLRNHRIKVAFFRENGQIGLVKTVQVLPQQTTTVPFVNDNFVAVLPNFEDHTFASLVFDAQSLKFFRENLLRIDDWLSRLLILRAMSDMVRFAKMKSTEFAQLETEEFLSEMTNNKFTFEIALGFFSVAASEFSPSEVRKTLWTQRFEALIKFVERESRPEIIQVIKPFLLECCFDSKHVQLLKEVLEEVHPLSSKLKLSMADKWSVLFKMWNKKEFSKVQFNMLKEYLLSLDKSDSRKLQMARLKALEAPVEQLKGLWELAASKDRKMSHSELASLLGGLTRRPELLSHMEKWEEFYGESLLRLINEDEKVNAMTFLRNGRINPDNFPHWNHKLQELLSKIEPQNQHFKTELMKLLDQMDKRQKAFGLH